MRILTSALALAALAAAPAFADDAELRDLASAMFEPIPSMPPALEGNAVTRDRVELGKMLFFEPRLSRSGLISCNTCHNLGMGGDDNLETSFGHGWQRGPRNSPTVLNAVFNVAQFWDGRAADLKTQAKGPVQAGVEMANTPARVVATLTSMPEYVAQFELAFPNETDPITFDNMAKALEAFQATMITPASPFDQWLEGNDAAMTDLQKEGLQLFIDQGCASCHMGVNFGGQEYYPFGVMEQPGAEILPPEDKGRFKVTQTATDEYVFRAGPLRNIALTAPYFHSGKVWELDQAVAIMGVSQLGADLTEADVEAITAFLVALTGEQPSVEYPILPASTANTPLPEMMIPTAVE